MELTFTNEYSEEFDEYEEIYIQIMKKTFKHIKKKGNFIVEVKTHIFFTIIFKYMSKFATCNYKIKIFIFEILTCLQISWSG